jgi:hypothetical protein
VIDPVQLGKRRRRMAFQSKHDDYLSFSEDDDIKIAGPVLKMPKLGQNPQLTL